MKRSSSKNTAKSTKLFHGIPLKRSAPAMIYLLRPFNSTGPSSIAIDLTRDRKGLDSAQAKIAGAALRPSEIVAGGYPPEVGYRAHVAFYTAYSVLKMMEGVSSRRKAFILVSNGYNFDLWPGMASSAANPFSRSGNEFSVEHLREEVAELTSQAKRAHVTIYAIDPRALSGAPTLWIAALCVLLAHFGGTILWVFSTVLLQLEVPDRFRGRVFAVELALVTLVTSASSYWTGYQLDHVGRSPRTLSFALGAMFCVPGALWLVIQSRWREREPAGVAQPTPSPEEEILEGRIG